MRAVLLDVDGTLVESNHYHVLAWQAAFRAIGKEIGYAELHAQMGKGADQRLPVFCTAEELRCTAKRWPSCTRRSISSATSS